MWKCPQGTDFCKPLCEWSNLPCKGAFATCIFEAWRKLFCSLVKVSRKSVPVRMCSLWRLPVVNLSPLRCEIERWKRHSLNPNGQAVACVTKLFTVRKRIIQIDFDDQQSINELLYSPNARESDDKSPKSNVILLGAMARATREVLLQDSRQEEAVSNSINVWASCSRLYLGPPSQDVADVSLLSWIPNRSCLYCCTVYFHGGAHTMAQEQSNGNAAHTCGYVAMPWQWMQLVPKPPHRYRAYSRYVWSLGRPRTQCV